MGSSCVAVGDHLSALSWPSGVGEGGWEGDTRGADSFCYKAETNTPLYSNYTPIKMLKKKKVTLHLYLKNSITLQGKSLQIQFNKSKILRRSDWHPFDPWFAPTITLGACHHDKVSGFVPWGLGDVGSPSYSSPQPGQGTGSFFLSPRLLIRL